MSDIDSIRLVFDLNKINQRQKIIPFSHYSIKKNSNNYEYEERIIGDTDNILDYLVEVDFNPNLDKYLNNTLKIVKCKKSIRKDLDNLAYIDEMGDSFSKRLINRLESTKQGIEQAETKILPLFKSNDKSELIKFFKDKIREHPEYSYMLLEDLINDVEHGLTSISGYV